MINGIINSFLDLFFVTTISFFKVLIFTNSENLNDLNMDAW